MTLKRTKHHKTKHVPDTKTLAIVRKMASEGHNLTKIGKELGISTSNVRRCYSKELENVELDSIGGKVMYQVNPDHRTAVEGMALAGITVEKIGRVIGVSGDTVRRYYRDELENAESRRLGNIARNLYSQAEGSAPTNGNAIFMLKARAGWRDNDEKEIALNYVEVMSNIEKRLPG